MKTNSAPSTISSRCEEINAQFVCIPLYGCISQITNWEDGQDSHTAIPQRALEYESELVKNQI